MNREHTDTSSLLWRCGLALLVLVAWLLTTAKGQAEGTSKTANTNPYPYPSLHVKHVFGFENVRRNAGGELSIQAGDLIFQEDGKTTAQVSIASIQNISLGDQDKQVGGVPMMLGKAAVPFGGGRVVSLFSHKKYDSLTIEYVDSNGGFHGSVFLADKGEAPVLRDELVARGARKSEPEEPALPPVEASEAPKDAQPWSVLVRRIDPGDTTLDPSFSSAIYENLMKELPRSKQFKTVFRSGDRNANDASGLLILKTLVTKYNPGSETRRAVTTVTGATKVKVEIQLLTRDGRVLLSQDVEGDVRFIGDNLRATSKVAHNAAKILARANLSPGAAAAQPATASE